MRIGIDIRSLQNDSKNRGIGTYTRCLTKNILSKGPDNDYVFFAFKDMPLSPLLKNGVFKDIKIRKVNHRRLPFVSLSGQALFPYAIKQENLDIFHSPEHMLPVFSGCRKVITVHDFNGTECRMYRERQNLLSKSYYYLRYKSAGCADKIIAVSEYTKKKIAQFVGVKEEKIKVIYEAAQECFKPLDDKGLFIGLRNKYNIDGDFLFYTGAIAPHKNIDLLIRAFSRSGFKELALVLAGVDNNKEYVASIKARILELKLQERVHILGYVPPEDLAGLYNMAKIVISVSLYEGFGLPILEAMACAKPVIASGNTSMREIVGEAGILVDPYSIEEVSEAINNLLSDEELRNALAVKGLQRSREFSWEKAAKETLSLYAELAGE